MSATDGHAEQQSEAMKLATILDDKRSQGPVVRLSRDLARRVQIALEDAASAHALLARRPHAPLAAGAGGQPQGDNTNT